MPNAPLVKIKAATAAEVCAAFSLDDEALPFLADGMAPCDFLEVFLPRSNTSQGSIFSLTLSRRATPSGGAVCACNKRSVRS